MTSVPTLCGDWLGNWRSEIFIYGSVQSRILPEIISWRRAIKQKGPCELLTVGSEGVSLYRVPTVICRRWRRRCFVTLNLTATANNTGKTRSLPKDCRSGEGVTESFTVTQMDATGIALPALEAGISRKLYIDRIKDIPIQRIAIKSIRKRRVRWDNNRTGSLQAPAFMTIAMPNSGPLITTMLWGD